MHEQGIEPPIFVADENGDLLLFLSVAEAEGYVESPEVDEYSAFDNTGRKLRLLGKTEPTGRFIKTVEIGPVQLVSEESEPTHQEELRALILRFLNAIGEPIEHREAESLQEFTELATEKFSRRRGSLRNLFRRGRS